MITGDKRFGPGHPRFDAQAAAVEKLQVLYWGRGALWPKTPREHFDVVTAQDPFWRGHVAWHMSRRLKAKLNIQVHTDLMAHSWLKRFFATIQLRRADSIRVVSETIKQQVVRMGARAPIAVLPVYVEVEKFRTISPEPHSGKILLWVGRFEDEKDPFKAIDVLKAVCEAGIDARLILLGAGSLEEMLRAKAKGLPVEFPGWQDPAVYLGRSDVVLSTSRHESWGQSIVEALAAGVPVVAPDVGVAKEAGATVVSRQELARATIDALRSGARGALRLPLLGKEAWAAAWVQSLS